MSDSQVFCSRPKSVLKRQLRLMILISFPISGSMSGFTSDSHHYKILKISRSGVFFYIIPAVMSYEHPINWQYRESQRFGTSVNRNQQIGTISRHVRLCHASSVHVRTEIIIWNKCVYIRCQKFNFSPFALTIKKIKNQLIIHSSDNF